MATIMKLKTLQPVTEAQWLEQAKRFSRITDITNQHNYPKTGVDNLHAEISLDVVQPLTKGFKGHVIYKQFFEVPAGETTTVKEHVVVDYYEIIPRDMANLMLDQFSVNVPTEITSYIDKQDWIIEQAFINQVVTKQTFGTLTAEDYILSK